MVLQNSPLEDPPLIPATLDTSALALAVSSLLQRTLAEIPAQAFDRMALVVIYDKLLQLERTLTSARSGKRK